MPIRAFAEALSPTAVFFLVQALSFFLGLLVYPFSLPGWSFVVADQVFFLFVCEVSR